MKMTKKKVIWLVLAAVLIALLGFGLKYLSDTKAYKDKVNNMTFENFALDGIADGVYTGECDVDFIYAKVAVTMKNGQIQSIDLLEHKNERGASAEVMTEKIVEAQSLEVDAISGATNSSKVIKKAVENALTKMIICYL